MAEHDCPVRALGRRWGGVRSVFDRAWTALVGDRIGAGLLVGSLCVYVLTWQVGIVIVDTYAVANGLVAVADGHLAVETAQYGPGLETPGMQVVDGEFYARNYGQIVAALPVLWLLDVVDAAAELRVAMAAVWSLCLIWFARILASVVDDRRALAGGAAVGLGLFALNLRAPTPVPDAQTPVMALQVVSMLAGGLCGVLLYRLVAQFRERRIAALAGALVVVGTPVAFWATIPKRHTLTTALVLGVGYLLYRSRSADRADPWRTTSLRVGMYGLVGLLTWIHAPIAVTLLLALAVVDVATAPSNGPRQLAGVAGGFVVSLVPFFATNLLISGNPLVPPRLLPAASSRTTDTVSSGGGGSFGGESFIGEMVGFAFSAVSTVLLTYWNGVVAIVRDPVDLYHTLVVSSGDIPRVGPESLAQASNLSMLEASPLLGAAVVVPVGIVAVRLRESPELLGAYRPSPTTSLFVGFGTLLVLIYSPRLPLFGQITVRYLTPLYPIAVYGICTFDGFERALATRWWDCVYAYEATVLLGVPLFLVGMVWFGLDEPATYEALSGIGLAVGGTLGAGAATTLVSDRFDRGFAALVGLAAGFTTVFVLLSLLVLYHYGIHQIPVVQELTETARYYIVRFTLSGGPFGLV